MRKKIYMYRCFFRIFPVAGMSGNEIFFFFFFFFLQKLFLGYCPKYIVRKYFVLQESGLYCRDLGLK